MSIEILNVVAPILIIVALGYLIETRGFGLDSAQLSRLVMALGTPSLVFSALMRAALSGDDIAMLMGCALVVLLVGGVLTAAVLTVLRLPLTPVLPVLAMPNAGNTGLPVLLFAFGEEGLAIGVALYISHYAPRRLSATLGYVIDLLAAVPSVVYGRWGLLFLSRELAPCYQ